jgi:hypothetical protein
MNIEHLINDILIAKKKKKKPTPISWFNSLFCTGEQTNRPEALVLGQYRIR